MASKVFIDANARVLAGLEPSEVVDPNTDPTSRVYDIVRQQVLTWSCWGWAMRAEALVALSGVSPPPGYLTMWRKPSPAVEKLLRIVKVTDVSGSTVRHWREFRDGIALAVSATAPVVWYTVDVEEEQWPAIVVSAMTHMLAASYVRTIREDAQSAQQLLELGLTMLRRAAAQDAQTGEAKVLPRIPV